MSVDPSKPVKIIVVHGVQLGKDKDQKQHVDIKNLIKNRLAGVPLSYTTEMHTYEDINDNAIKDIKSLLKLISKSPVASILSQVTLEVVADVVISLKNGSTATSIRAGLSKRILECYKKGQPCYVVAHSLGSIYALDVINELIAGDNEFFDRDRRETWPVQALVTLGSPIGLDMFRHNRPNVASLGTGSKMFKWLNYWDRTDPVVSGQIFGKYLKGFDIAQSYIEETREQGWMIRDIPVDTGNRWLLAHTSYWTDSKVGDGIVDLIF